MIGVIDDLRSRLGTDRVDLLWLSFVDSAEDYAGVMSETGLLGIARGLCRAGKARFIGLSTHVCSTAARAVDSGAIDAFMFPVNPAHDLISDRSWADAWKADTYRPLPGRAIGPGEERRGLYLRCLERGVADVQSGDLARAMGIYLSPVQCLSYVLSQPGVSTTVPGCRNPAELRAALAYFEAGPAERDFSAIDANALWKLRRRCVYCDHFLPCPERIEIGSLMRLLDIVERTSADGLGAVERALARSAGKCTRCGV